MEGHQIFISYSSANVDTATTVCAKIEEAGYPCWIAPRNEQAGMPYGQQITNAIKQAKVVVLMFSEASNKSQHVLNEVSIAFETNRKIIPVMLDTSEMCADLQYFLTRTHHISAFNGFDEALRELVSSISSTVVPNVEVKKDVPEQKTDGYQMATKLTETLINNSIDMSVAVSRFHDIIKTIPNWTQQERILSKAKEIISYSFIGVIGKDFNKIMAISNENSADKCYKFCYACKRIIAITLDLTIFALISRLWDASNAKLITLDTDEKETIRKRLIMPYRLTVHEEIDLVYSMLQTFEKYKDKVELPIPELKALQPKLKCGGELDEACKRLSDINEETATMEQCRQAEDELTTVMCAFNFYMRYHIVSMKWSKCKKSRIFNTQFVNRYVALGLDNKSNIDMEKVNLTESASSTDSVVMYTDSMSDNKSINMYPLVIDLNTINRENGSKICFLYANPMNNTSLEYISLDDGKIQTLTNKRIKQKVSDLNEIFMSDDDIKTYNTDTVIDTFEILQQSLLGEMYVDFGDL